VSVNRYLFILSEQTHHFEHHAFIYHLVFKLLCVHYCSFYGLGTPLLQIKKHYWTCCGNCGLSCQRMDVKRPSLWICWVISHSKQHRQARR